MVRISDNKPVISSIQNHKVKNTSLLLKKSRERARQNLFVVEGKKEILRALQAGYFFREIFICRDIFGDGGEDEDKRKSGESERSGNGMSGNMDILDSLGKRSSINYVSAGVYAHMAYRKDTEGVLGWAVPRDHPLDEIKLSDHPLLLVLDAVEKPGNLGAILRTSDASGIDALIISDPRTDIYNPNVVRSSLGALFSIQIGIGDTDEVIKWLKSKKIRILCTSLTASKSYLNIDFRPATAIVMGTEATGLSEKWLSQSDQNVIIPMKGQMDSLNVSVSAGIVLFEAVRQRG